MGFATFLARLPSARWDRWVWPLVLACCIALVHGLPRSGGALAITVDAQQAGVAQIYFDSGNGFSEAETQQLPLRPGTNQLRFSLPQKSFRGFRFDPTTNDGVVTIKGIELWRNGASVAEAISLSRVINPVNAEKVEVDGATLKIIPTPGINDAQVLIDSPANLQPKNTAVLGSIYLGSLLAAALWLMFAIAQSRRVSTRLLVGGCAFAALGLILSLASITGHAISQHPDEFTHLIALNYFLTQGVLPPAVTDPNVVPASVWGTSYLFERDVVYALAGRVLAPFGITTPDAMVPARLFNVAQWGVLALLACWQRRWAAALAIILLTPQIWYLYSYFNADAFPLTLTLIAGSLVIDEQGALARYIRTGGVRLWTVLPAVLAIGLILVSKRNYTAVVPALAMWLAIRHCGFGAAHTALGLLGLAFAGTATFFAAPLFGGPPLPGASWLYAGGASLLALCVALYAWRLRGEPSFRRPFFRLVIFCCLCAAVVLPQYLWDLHQNGSPQTKRAAIESIIEQRASPEFRPSVFLTGKGYYSLMPIRRGDSLSDVFESPKWQWASLSWRSSFGLYGYMNVAAPGWTYIALTSVFSSVMLLGLVGLRRRQPGQWPALTLCVLGGVFLVAWSSLMHSWVNAFSPQGRYLLPAIALLSLPLGYAIDQLPRTAFRMLVLCGFAISVLSFAGYAIPTFATVGR